MWYYQNYLILHREHCPVIVHNSLKSSMETLLPLECSAFEKIFTQAILHVHRTWTTRSSTHHKPTKVFTRVPQLIYASTHRLVCLPFTSEVSPEEFLRTICQLLLKRIDFKSATPLKATSCANAYFSPPRPRPVSRLFFQSSVPTTPIAKTEVWENN